MPVSEKPKPKSNKKIVNAVLSAAMARQANTIYPLPDDVDEADGKRVVADLVHNGLAHGGRYPNLTRSGCDFARTKLADDDDR